MGDIRRKELNFLDQAITVTNAGSNLTFYRVHVTPSNYSGSITFYVEVVVSTSNSSATVKDLRLWPQTTGGSVALFNITSGATNTLFLSSAMALSGVEQDYFINFNSWNTWLAGDTCTIKSAKLIIIQDTGTNLLTGTESQYEIGNAELNVGVSTAGTLQKLAAPKYWKYEATNFDGNCSFYGECNYNVSTTTGNKTIVIQEATSAEPTATWTTVATLLNASTGSVSVARVRSSAFTPVDGRYYRLAWTNSSTMSNVSIYNAKIIVIQTSATEITKTEDHYLVANTTLAAGTALQNFLTKWDSAQWGGVTNTYFHQVDAGDNNTSVVELDSITSGSAVANSSVSSPDNYKQSTLALTMPTSQNLDVKATTNSGSIFGSRIIVKTVKDVAPITFTPIAPKMYIYIV